MMASGTKPCQTFVHCNGDEMPCPASDRNVGEFWYHGRNWPNRLTTVTSLLIDNRAIGLLLKKWRSKNTPFYRLWFLQLSVTVSIHQLSCVIIFLFQPFTTLTCLREINECRGILILLLVLSLRLLIVWTLATSNECSLESHACHW